MFLGHYEHTIDEKGRLTIPARFREQLNDGAYVTQGFDNNLMVLTNQSFQQMYANVNAISMTDPNARSLKRLIFSNAEKVEVDRVGRILISQYLREIAHLQSEAVIVGIGESFEIWTPEAWARQNEALQNPENNETRFAMFNLPTA